MNKPKPHNGGEWTVARYQSFIKSALRKAAWPPKYKAIDRMFVRNGINPESGRMCKLHKCEHCERLFPKTKLNADHIDPVVPVTGFDSWDNVIRRLFCEIEGFQALCSECHAIKTAEERKQRQAAKKL